MKTILNRCALLLAGWLVVTTGSAQVFNDSCHQAFSFDTIDNNGPEPCFDGTIGSFDTSVIFINGFGPIGAESPYWSALNCMGYTSATQPGWADMWFKFYPVTGGFYPVDLYIVATADTLHVTFWAFYGCDSLQAMCCYTLSGGGVIYETVTCSPGSACTPEDWVYVQISGPNSFQIDGMCIGIDTVVASAPVCCPWILTCFEYQLNYTDPTTADDSNGTATVNITWGTGPFTYLWNDGDTNSTRTGLDTGTYIVTITDGLGCSYTDTIQLTGSTGTGLQVQNDLVRLYPNPAGHEVYLQLKNPGHWKQLTVKDMSGQAVMCIPLPNAVEQRLSLSLEAGSYVFEFLDGNGRTQSRRMVVAP